MSDSPWAILSNDDKKPVPLKLKPRQSMQTPPKLDFIEYKVTHKKNAIKKSPFTKTIHSTKLT